MGIIKAVPLPHTVLVASRPPGLVSILIAAQRKSESGCRVEGVPKGVT